MELVFLSSLCLLVVYVAFVTHQTRAGQLKHQTEFKDALLSLTGRAKKAEEHNESLLSQLASLTQALRLAEERASRENVLATQAEFFKQRNSYLEEVVVGFADARLQASLARQGNPQPREESTAASSPSLWSLASGKRVREEPRMPVVEPTKTVAQ